MEQCSPRQPDDQGSGNAVRGFRRSGSSSARASTSTSPSSSRARCAARWPRRTWTASRRSRRAGEISARIASVASMFVSRLDVLVDPMLEARAESKPPVEQTRLRSLVGKVAIANAKLAYQDAKELRRGARWTCARRARREAATPVVGEHEHARIRGSVTSCTSNRSSAPTRSTRFHRRRSMLSVTMGKAGSHLEENVDDAREVLATLAHAGISDRRPDRPPPRRRRPQSSPRPSTRSWPR